MKANELLELQTSADTQDNAKSISTNETKFERIEGTPFAIVKQNKGWFIALGQYKVSDYYLTKEQAKKDIQRKDWDLILNVVSVLIEMSNKLNNKTK